MSFGVSRSTWAKAWLSVMTMRGLTASFSKVGARVFSFTTMAVQSASSTSRMVCCWGRISLPLGAALSMGVTRTTRSPGVSRSPTRRLSSPCERVSRAMRSFSSSMPSLVTALTASSFSPSWGAAAKSLLL